MSAFSYCISLPKKRLKDMETRYSTSLSTLKSIGPNVTHSSFSAFSYLH